MKAQLLEAVWSRNRYVEVVRVGNKVAVVRTFQDGSGSSTFVPGFEKPDDDALAEALEANKPDREAWFCEWGRRPQDRKA